MKTHLLETLIPSTNNMPMIDITELTAVEESKLRDAHARDYMGTDDDMPDDFESWLELLSDEELYNILSK